MTTLNIASKANQATTLPALLVVAQVNELDPNASISVNFEEVEALRHTKGEAVELIVGSDSPIYSSEKIITHLIESYPTLQGPNETRVRLDVITTRLEVHTYMLQVQEWLSRTASFHYTDFKSVEGPLLELDAHLTLRSYVVGYVLSTADLSVWGAIRGNRVAYAAVKKGSMMNMCRWFKFVEETNPWLSTAIQSINQAAHEKKAAKSKEGASYDIALPDTDKGVVTRFPPEPS